MHYKNGRYNNSKVIPKKKIFFISQNLSELHGSNSQKIQVLWDPLEYRKPWFNRSSCSKIMMNTHTHTFIHQNIYVRIMTIVCSGPKTWRSDKNLIFLIRGQNKLLHSFENHEFSKICVQFFITHFLGTVTFFTFQVSHHIYMLHNTHCLL